MHSKEKEKEKNVYDGKFSVMLFNHKFKKIKVKKNHEVRNLYGYFTDMIVKYNFSIDNSMNYLYVAWGEYIFKS